MKVLAIETSCDETGVALVEGERTAEGLRFTTLGESLLSQAKLHAEYGGVYPNLAKREHEKNLPHILEQSLAKAKLAIAEVEAIVVTEGPGLEPALWTGIEFAKKLSAEYGKPLFGVNHMEGHIVSSLALLENDKSQVPNAKQSSYSSVLQNTRIRIAYELRNVDFPVLALLVSGGHTELVLMREWFRYEIIGRTLDDAVGEAFDKVARMLGLPYPGGPHISKLAGEARATGKTQAAALPRPMLHANTCDMSFSGLKTAALYALRDMGGIQKLSADEISQFAREFEDAVGDVLALKTRRALEETSAQTFVLGGGVAANLYLREKLQALVQAEFPGVEFRLPHLAITGDNAVMIGQAALVHFLEKDWSLETPPSDIKAQGNLSLAQ